MNQQVQADPVQMNAMARAMVLQRSINMWQPVFQQTYNSGAGTVINIPVRNVGLVKRLVVEITGVMNVGAGMTQNITPWGLANIFSNITLTDLSNQTRINTTGWHLHAIASAKRQWAWGSAYTNDSPVAFGSNYSVIRAPQAYVADGATFRYFLEIPISYGDLDLRGAIYANVVNATFNLQLTVNPNFFVPSTVDGTLAVYKSSGATLGSVSSFSLILHQNYLDQLPQGKNGPILPLLDLGTAYLLNNTSVSGILNGQDNPIPYANFRDFYSTVCIYQNFGYTGGTGNDLSTWKLQSANYTNILNYDPFMSSLLTRQILSDDMPAISGSCAYYFDHRSKPISTIQYGNMQLVFTPSNVQNAATAMLVGYEALAYINQVTQAGSLYGT